MIFSEEYVFCTEPTIHTTLHIRRFLFFSILSFFFRRESRSLKMEIIKQTYLAAKIKEELRELKRNKQHNANLRTQILVHDSFNIVETTPMSSPSSLGMFHPKEKRRRSATGAKSRSIALRPERSG